MRKAMKKTIFKSTLIALTGIGVFFAGNASAALLSDEFDSYWEFSGLDLIASWFASTNTTITGLDFGIYSQQNDSLTSSLLDLSKSSAQVDTYTTLWSGYYGFYYIAANGVTYYSDSSKNAGNVDVMFFDDDTENFSISSGGIYASYSLTIDLDGGTAAGNDFYAILTATPAPEPATVLLFGAGLAGLTGIVRRKRK